MFRIYKGVVRNGVIVLEGDGQLPEGTKVTVLVEEVEETTSKTNWQRLSEIVGAFDSGVSNISERKHEYLAEAHERCGGTDKK